MKKVFLMLMVVMLLSCFAFPAAVAQGNVTTLRFSWWGSASRAEVYNAICDEFEAAYPQYKIEREFTSGTAKYMELLATQVAGGNAPDIVSMHPRYQADYVARGVLLDLAEYVSSGVIDTEKIAPSILASGMVNSKLYGLPQGVNVSEWFVNKTYCDLFGVTVPNENTFWTWDEFIENCYTFRKNALAAGYDAYLAEESIDYNFFRLYARSRGAEIFTEDGKLGHDAQLLADYWSIWKKLQADDVIPSAEDTVVDKSASLEEKYFTIGKVATIEKAVSQYDQYVAASQFEIGIMHVPAYEGTNNGVYTEGCHIGVSGQSDKAHQDGAALFVNFFVNDWRSVQHLQLQQGIQANSEMSKKVSEIVSPEKQVIIAWIENWINNYDLPSGVNPPVGFSAVANLFEEYRQYVSFGNMTPQEAADAFVAEAQSVLDNE